MLTFLSSPASHRRFRSTQLAKESLSDRRPMTLNGTKTLAGCEEWASNPGVYSIDASRDHYEDQALVAETMVMDGEFFRGVK